MKQIGNQKKKKKEQKKRDKAGRGEPFGPATESATTQLLIVPKHYAAPSFGH
jgi:hypothetical protein